MVLSSKKTFKILIVLLVALLIDAPLLLVFLAIALCLYVYLFKNGDFTSVINNFVKRLERINGTKLFLACGLTVASMSVYQSAGYITHLGFPFSFVPITTSQLLLEQARFGASWRLMA
jgi:hypothetical protein